MRRAFLDTLTELVVADPTVMLLTADTGFHVFDQFRQRFPGNFLNVGISEAAMIGMAAGLAMEGRKVFVYAIAPFATLRCLEQIRVDLCCQNLPVKIVGVGAGLTYGSAGPTHHSIEDIAVLRPLPNMTVICPGDPAETRAAVRACLDLSGPCYLRLGKSGEPMVHAGELVGFRIGRGIVLSSGRDLAVICTGNMLAAGQELCRLLAGKGHDAGLVSLPCVKPIDAELLTGLAESLPLLVSVEEHNLIGGLGAAIAELLADRCCPTRLLRFGIPDRFADRAGSQEYLREQFGLSPAQMADRVASALRGCV
jgi:transketolase